MSDVQTPVQPKPIEVLRPVSQQFLTPARWRRERRDGREVFSQTLHVVTADGAPPDMAIVQREQLRQLERKLADLAAVTRMASKVTKARCRHDAVHFAMGELEHALEELGL